MSEFKSRVEVIENAKTLESSTENHNEELLRSGELKQNSPSEKTINIEEVRDQLHRQSDINTELTLDKNTEDSQPQIIDRATKADSLNKELGLIRLKLTASQRILSKTIHMPLISKSSDVGAKTVARPSGLLGGGILAFCGSLTSLLFSKYIGIRFNYLIFIFLFIIGYGLSVASELLFKSAKRHK